MFFDSMTHYFEKITSQTHFFRTDLQSVTWRQTDRVSFKIAAMGHAAMVMALKQS